MPKKSIHQKSSSRVRRKATRRKRKQKLSTRRVKRVKMMTPTIIRKILMGPNQIQAGHQKRTKRKKMPRGRLMF